LHGGRGGEGEGEGVGGEAAAGGSGTELGACVSDVLMTLRNTEQANQYGRHCAHSGARHVLSRVIASGNVSAASGSAGTSVHVRRDSAIRSARHALEIHGAIVREASFQHAGRNSEISGGRQRRSTR